MSVWKKAAKSHQKNHFERHQPENRKHLGLLEKKKDYVRRAQDFNEKKATLKLLRKRALNKNADEFYHHMINSKTENGAHFDKETETEDTPEQLSLMRSQDLKYITNKRTQEQKQIKKLQAQLHFANVGHQVENKHIYFNKNLDSKNGKANSLAAVLSKTELPDVDLDDLAVAARKKKHLYQELGKRIHREAELSIVQQKIQLKKHLENKTNVLPPKRIKKANHNRAAVYVWKYERKK